MVKRMTKQEARKLLKNAGIDLGLDYHQLRMSDVDKVEAVSRLYGYRRPRNAPGSTSRMFFQFLQRGK